jgi:choline dehydrogenase-like flavoprotein
MAWRFLPDDFRMASKYGVPEGSSPSDWPFAYDDLAPYYKLAEDEIGVSGDSASEPSNRPNRAGYPMQALPLNNQGRLLGEAAGKLGWRTQRVPLLINSIERGGRPACANCQHCVGFACPVDAKNGTQNTMIARALSTGRCSVVTGAMVSAIDCDASGHVSGVSYFDKEGNVVTAAADVVILSGGAIETARLLLNSKSAQEPNGLGNNTDQVGRNLQGHYYAGGVGWTTEPIWDGVGPGTTTATIEFNHDNDGIVGGGMLADDFVMLPIVYLKRRFDSDIPKWGIAHKQWMRDTYRRKLYITGPVHEIPSAEARVTADPFVTDRWGVPVARLSGTTHPETLRVYEFMSKRAEEWLHAAGANNVRTFPTGLGLSGGQHQAGTCRMGVDPNTSVTNSWGKIHGHDNLFVADGSLNVTNGGFNPVLTILALSFRVADGIKSSW